jgi:hypothetical protein
MDIRAATREQMNYPDIKGHNVMTFVSRSACTQFSLDNSKKVNNAPDNPWYPSVTANKKLSNSMLLLSFFVLSMARDINAAGDGREELATDSKACMASSYLAPPQGLAVPSGADVG